MTGKFIVFYGVNNLGKSTQAKLLVEKLAARGLAAEYLKYPLYDLAPSGPLLNQYLRQSNPFNLSPREAQLLYAMNRWQYQNELKAKLAAGAWLVAEDYTGTGLAWGVGAGVDEKFLLTVNDGLVVEDLAILFDGQRFLEAVESGHQHETDNELTAKVRAAHHYFGERFRWPLVNANLSIEEVAEKIWEIVQTIL